MAAGALDEPLLQASAVDSAMLVTEVVFRKQRWMLTYFPSSAGVIDAAELMFSRAISHETYRIPLSEIYGIVDGTTACMLDLHTFTRHTPHEWRPVALSVIFPVPAVQLAWVAVLKAVVSADMARPRLLRVFVNPISGRKHGVQIFDRLRPLFARAQCVLDVVHTTHSGQVRDALRLEALTDLDGVVLVGGDGLFHEAINGMLARRDGARKPLGVVPAGSTNSTAWSVFGSGSAATAALQIILGHKHPIDVGAISAGKRPEPVYLVLFDRIFFLIS